MKKYIGLFCASIGVVAGAPSPMKSGDDSALGLASGQRQFAAAPPASVSSLIYYESGRTTARSYFSLGVVLEPDGVARGLFVTGSFGESLTITGSPESGTWTYRIVDDRTAELTISTPTGSGPIAGCRTLVYATERSGEMYSLVVSAGTFQFGDLSPGSTLVNCSNRSSVAPGRSAFTGFVVTGDRPRTVLLRAVGPGLSQFGVSDSLSDPRLTVTYRGQLIAQNDDWHSTGGGSIQATGLIVGAFPLPSDSRDAALVLMVSPGDYVAEASGGSATDSGQVLVEVYVLP